MRIEDFIKENIDEFNVEEPNEGHFERLEQRLKSRKRKQVKMYTYLSAAAIASCIIIGQAIWKNFQQNSMPSCTFSDEIVELQNYYNSTLNAEIEQVEKLIAVADPGIHPDMTQDIAQIKIETQQISLDICGNSGDNVIAALVEFYQSQITALQNMSEIIENQLLQYKI